MRKFFSDKQMTLLVGLSLCALSLLGLHMKIPYSGWLMFVGILLVL